MYFADLWEVAYLPDHDPAKNTLWRGIRYFDRGLGPSLLRPGDTNEPKDALFRTCFRPLETGVLHVGLRFWTQFTNTWDEKVPVQRLAPNSNQGSGPEKRWDSSRRTDRAFILHKSQFDRTNPDFVYPEIVQVTVVLESTLPEVHGMRLAEGCDDKSAVLRLNHTRGLPEAPAMVKIEAEWIEYGGKTFTEITSCRRGQRGTAAAAHVVPSEVHFGESFTTDVRVSAYREAQQP
jgi:hypothetical protein